MIASAPPITQSNQINRDRCKAAVTTLIASSGMSRCSHTPITTWATTSASCAVVTVCHQNARPLLYDRFMSIAGTHPRAVVPLGPRDFRYRIRRIGPFAAVLPACALAIVATMMLHGNTSTSSGVAGFAAIVFAAPGLLVAGIPLTTESGRTFLGVMGSIALWLVLGVVASRRATRSPVAMWRDYWREYLWLAVGVWAGVVMGLALTELFVGRALL